MSPEVTCELCGKAAKEPILDAESGSEFCPGCAIEGAVALAAERPAHLDWPDPACVCGCRDFNVETSACENCGRVGAAPVSPIYEIERDRHGLMYSGPLGVGECVRVRPVASREKAA